MTDYLKLVARKDGFLGRLDDFLKQSYENKDKENNAALLVQRVFRGSVSRFQLTRKHYAANEIQRVFRGIVGRLKSLSEAVQKSQRRKLYYLHYLCIQLQRCFRGYHSRKYKYDQARRKLYIRMLEEKRREVLQQMEKYAAEQAEREAEEAKVKRDDEFRNLAQNLHHLVGTRHVRGIYNPQVELIEAPTMNNMPVEYHIRAVVKDLLRTRGITKRGLVADINGTMKIPLKINKERLSLQASTPYDLMQKEAAKTRMLHRIITADKGHFLGGGKTKLIDHNETPLAVGDPFLDAWANPMLVKGVPANQKQLLECARTQKALFAKPVDKPFFTRVGGNKSSTLPNDVFDTIAEAEETGGAIQRHLGMGTTRFGLSSSMDARSVSAVPTSTTTNNTLIPHEPYRTSSTMRSTQKRVRTYKLGPRSKDSSLRVPAGGRIPPLNGTMSEVLENIEEVSYLSVSQSNHSSLMKGEGDDDSSSDEEDLAIRQASYLQQLQQQLQQRSTASLEA